VFEYWALDNIRDDIPYTNDLTWRGNGNFTGMSYRQVDSSRGVGQTQLLDVRTCNWFQKEYTWECCDCLAAYTPTRLAVGMRTIRVGMCEVLHLHETLNTDYFICERLAVQGSLMTSYVLHLTPTGYLLSHQ
jgi:hypothetical protein